MLSTIESDYIKGLISVYKSKGYKSYICHTVTEQNNDYDFCIYFSKEDIIAVNNDVFSIKNGIKLYVDSTSRSYNNTTPRVILSNSNYSGSFSVHTAEFIYTNAILDYSEGAYVLNPDISKSGVTNYEFDSFGIILLVIVLTILLFNFIRVILRIK